MRQDTGDTRRQPKKMSGARFATKKPTQNLFPKLCEMRLNLPLRERGLGEREAGRRGAARCELLVRKHKLCESGRIDVAEHRGTRRQQRGIQEIHVK